MKKIISLLLCLLSLLVISVSALADSYSLISNENVRLEFPKTKYYYETSFQATVKASRRNGSIYFMPKPEAGNGELGQVADGTEVTILAEKSGYFFFVTEDGRYGWNGTKWFVYDEKDAEGAKWKDDATVSNTGVELEFPDPDDYYEVPFVLTVRSSKRGGAIYLMPKPQTGNGELGRVRDGQGVIILAKHKEYYFFQTQDGRFGWNSMNWFE